MTKEELLRKVAAVAPKKWEAVYHEDAKQVWFCAEGLTGEESCLNKLGCDLGLFCDLFDSRAMIAMLDHLESIGYDDHAICKATYGYFFTTEPTTYDTPGLSNHIEGNGPTRAHAVAEAFVQALTPDPTRGERVEGVEL